MNHPTLLLTAAMLLTFAPAVVGLNNECVGDDDEICHGGYSSESDDCSEASEAYQYDVYTIEVGEVRVVLTYDSWCAQTWCGLMDADAVGVQASQSAVGATSASSHIAQFGCGDAIPTRCYTYTSIWDSNTGQFASADPAAVSCPDVI